VIGQTVAQESLADVELTVFRKWSESQLQPGVGRWAYRQVLFVDSKPDYGYGSYDFEGLGLGLGLVLRLGLGYLYE